MANPVRLKCAAAEQAAVRLSMSWVIRIGRSALISVVATVQLLVEMGIRYHYDHWGPRSLLVASTYPAIFWLASAAATLHSQMRAVFTGPREKRVVWDVPREQVGSGAAPE